MSLVLLNASILTSTVTSAAPIQQPLVLRYAPECNVGDTYITSTGDWINTYMGLTDFQLLKGKIVDGGRVVDKGNLSLKIQTEDGNYAWVNLLGEDKWYPFLWQTGTEVQFRVYEKVNEPGTYVGGVFKFKYKDLDPISGLEYSFDKNKKDPYRVNITYAQKEGISQLMSAQKNEMMVVYIKGAKVVDELKDNTLIIKNSQGLYMRCVPPYANSLNPQNTKMKHYKKGDVFDCYAYLSNGYYEYNNKKLFSMIDTRVSK